MARDRCLSRREIVQGLSATALLSTSCGTNARLGSAPTACLGVNCYDLFGNFYQTNDREKLRNRLAFLSKYKVQFVRFSMVTDPFFKVGISALEREKYLSALVQVFEAAQEFRMKLVPSLFWSYRESALNAGEGVNAWSNAGSSTRNHANEIINWIVPAVRNLPALLMWEIANEMNSYADIVGSGAELSAFDARILTSAGLRGCLAELASTIRGLDRNTLITTGNDLPRRGAYSARMGRRFIDTPGQFGDNVAYLTPDPIGCTSVHVYPVRHNRDFFPFATFHDATAWAIKGSKQQGKKVFVGEFGIPRGASVQAEISLFKASFQDVITSGADFVALWVFDRNVKDSFNISPQDYRIYQLEEIARHSQ